MEKSIFDNPKLLKVFMWCLFKATHKERRTYIGNQHIELKPGEFITGRFAASEELNMNGSTVWRYLHTLQDNETIEVNSNNKYTVINVVNWANYQVDDSEHEHQMNNKRTSNEHQMNTNKNVKNEKNEKKSKGGKFNPPDILEITTYCKERNNDVDPERFHDFYQSKNWMIGKNKMKDWKAAVRTWEKKDKDEKPKELRNYTNDAKLREEAGY